MTEAFILSQSTVIECDAWVPAVRSAERILRRDMNAILRAAGPANRILLKQEPDKPGQSWRMEIGPDVLVIRHADALGGVYALLYLSEKFLGV